MKIAQLRSALKRLPSTDTEWATPQGVEELEALDKLLVEADDLSIIAFCAAVKVGKPKRKAKEKPDPKPNANLVDAYLSELRFASANAEEFKLVAAKLEKDKAIRLAEAKAIAAGYAGDFSAKTKRDAFKAIRQRRIADERSGNRRANLSDLF